MHEDLISIVIPIYNVEDFLEDCLWTVLNQTYTNLEVILSDDGSTDRCPKICDQYARKDKRVRVIHKKNGGLSDARNVGIDISKGKYITFVDSDDFIELDTIEYLYDLLQMEDADISFCQKKYVDMSGNEINDNKNYRDIVLKGNANCMKGFFTDKGIDTVAWGKLYRAELFKTIRYPYGKYHEDVYTTYKVIAKSNCIVVGAEKKYCYRMRNESITSSGFKMQHLNAIEANIERRDFVEAEYPELIRYANAGVIYAANQCVLRLIRHKGDIVEEGQVFEKKEILRELQTVYRKYEKDFLKGNSSIHAKIFSLIAFLNLKLIVKILCVRYRG